MDTEVLTTGQIARLLSEKLDGDLVMMTYVQHSLQRWIQAEIRKGKIRAEPPPPDGRPRHYYRVSVRELERALKEVPPSFWGDVWVRCQAKSTGISIRWARKRYLERYGPK